MANWQPCMYVYFKCSSTLGCRSTKQVEELSFKAFVREDLRD